MAAAAPVALAMQAVGGIVGGIEQNRAARSAAKVDDENARLTILEGEQQGLATARDERLQAGSMLAAMAGDGVQLGTGTAGDLLAESAYQRELEILGIRSRASQQASNLQQSAADRRKAGRAALIGGIFGAAATAVQGVSDLRSQRTASAQRNKERGVILGGGTVPRPSIAGVGR
jgi:hypothetical protein